MVSESKAREIFLELPEATEKSHHGTPDFRINNKIFATLHVGKRKAVLKLPVDMLEDLLAGRPDAFSTNGWSKHGWLELELAKFRAADLRALSEAAWRNVAPPKYKKLLG